MFAQALFSSYYSLTLESLAISNPKHLGSLR